MTRAIVASLLLFAAMFGMWAYRTYEQLNEVRLALHQAQETIQQERAAYSALRAAYDEQRKLYEDADRQAQAMLNTLDKEAGDWGTVCLPVGVSGLFCTSSTGAGNADNTGKPDARDGGSSLDSVNK